MLPVYEELCQMHYITVTISSIPPTHSYFTDETTGRVNDLIKITQQEVEPQI